MDVHRSAGGCRYRQEGDGCQEGDGWIIERLSP